MGVYLLARFVKVSRELIVNVQNLLSKSLTEERTPFVQIMSLNKVWDVIKQRVESENVRGKRM